MRILYKDFTWLTTQAKTLETKTIKKFGISLTFGGISRYLLRGIRNDNSAVVHQEDNTVWLDEEKYKQNKKETILYLDTTYSSPSKQARRNKTEKE